MIRHLLRSGVAWTFGLALAAFAIGSPPTRAATGSEPDAPATTLTETDSPAAAPIEADPLAAVLAEAGVSPDALGFRPSGTWARYPDPRSTRFRSRLFDDFFSDPGTIYPAIAVMARAAERFLEPAYSDTSGLALFKLAYYTGWDPHLSGFRDYNAGMTYFPAEDEPLVQAIARLWEGAGRRFDIVSFEQPADWPSLRDMVRAKVAPLDPELRRILAQAVLDLVEAREWHERAFRNVDLRDVLELWNVRDWGDTQSDGAEYFPQVLDIADHLDETSLVTSSRKTVYAAARLAVALRAWKAKHGAPSRFAAARLAPPATVEPEEGKLTSSGTQLYAEKRGTRSAALAERELDLWTPAGRIVVAGDGADIHEERDVLLMVDLGGDDKYREAVGATSSPTLPVAIAVDLSGNDAYEAADEMTVTQGSGIFGTGVLIDVAGNDTYQAGRCAQGFGLFGTGMLADLGGDDHYRLGTGGQGAGFWGVGLLCDRDGNDLYEMDGIAQGFGGIGGVGTLVDREGDDVYRAETDSREVPRPDYSHSAEYVNATGGQGSGMGRRGDISDGHAWAGGLGTLIDLAGDDQYLSGNWSLGSGYWYGMGFVYDKAGNDRYQATTFSLASGAHFCVAGLFDEAGDDVYEGLADARTGMGFGHDFTVAILFDRSGDDVYRFGWEGIGDAINTSQAFFVDGGGRDTYVLDAGKNGLGTTNFDPSHWPPPVEANYQAHTTEIGLFLDLGGEDQYLERSSNGDETPSALLHDDLFLLRPADPAIGDNRHYGIFRDETGDVEAISWFRTPVR